MIERRRKRERETGEEKNWKAGIGASYKRVCRGGREGEGEGAGVSRVMHIAGVTGEQAQENEYVALERIVFEL